MDCRGDDAVLPWRNMREAAEEEQMWAWGKIKN